jgi:putative oxidoreductase
MNKEKIMKFGGMFLRYAFGALFLIAGTMKLYGVPMLVAEFDTIGLGQWFRYFVGIWELVGGILMFVPMKRHIGAVLLFLASFGAFIAQIMTIHQDWIHTVVFMVLIGILIRQDKERYVRITN